MTASLTAAVRLSRLPAYWAYHYGSLREPARARAAVAHVAETIGTLPTAYRVGCRVALLSLALLNPGPRALPRIGHLPGLRQFLQVTTALALLGALDGVPASERV